MTEFMLLPKPAKLEQTHQGFTLSTGPRAALAEPGGAAADRVLLKELGAVGRSSDHADADIRVLPASEAPGDLRDWAGREEGYALSVDAEGVRLWAATAAGRLFLHGGGWASHYIMGQRRIEYADGAAQVVVLDRTNTADWNTGDGDFPGEEGTLTTVAWEGTTEEFPTVRIYQTLWINPYPRKTIRQVVLTNAAQSATQQAFLAVLGLTAAIIPES